MIKIIVDSCCDLPEELMEEYDIKSLPQRIYLNDVEYLDKVTISAEEVYEAMKRGVVPMTSLPAPADIAELFGRCCREGNNFIYIALSSKLSGTYQLAVSILKELEEQYEGIRMKAIDSKSASTIVAERIKNFPDQTIGISHAGDLELVSELKDMLFQRLGEKDIIINKIGAALVSHLGIGGVGVFFFNKEPKFYIE